MFSYRIMELEKKLSILYQKQGRSTQFSNKAARDKWLRKEIEDLKRVLDLNLSQVSLLYYIQKMNHTNMITVILLFKMEILPYLLYIYDIWIFYYLLYMASVSYDWLYNMLGLLQEQKLQDEIFRLNTDLTERDGDIKKCEVEIGELESHISKSHEQFNIKKRERDEEQRKRK